jgi:hypothetical protein
MAISPVKQESTRAVSGERMCGESRVRARVDFIQSSRSYSGPFPSSLFPNHAYRFHGAMALHRTFYGHRFDSSSLWHLSQRLIRLSSLSALVVSL